MSLTVDQAEQRQRIERLKARLRRTSHRTDATHAAELAAERQGIEFDRRVELASQKLIKESESTNG